MSDYKKMAAKGRHLVPPTDTMCFQVQLYGTRNDRRVLWDIAMYPKRKEGAPPSVAKQMRGSMTFQLMKGWVKYTMRSAKGSVYPLGPDRWRVQIEAPRDANTGKRSRPSTIVRGSRKKAEQVKAQMLIDAGYVSISSDIDVEEYAHSVFLNRKKKLIAKGKFKIRTLESYEERLRLHILPYIGHVQVQELRPIHVRMVQDAAPTDAVAREARKVLSSMITEAMYDELLASNPVKNVRPIDESDYEPEQLDVEDMEVYLWHFKDTRVENVVLLAIGGAYRRGEIVALNAEDINLDTGLVVIDDALVESREGTIPETPKNHKARTNVIPAVILERLRETLPESGPVITTLKGDRMKPNSVRKLYEKTLSTIPEGVPRIPLKNLRHTSLTAVYDATGKMDSSQIHGGHSSEITTKKYYVRPHDTQKYAAAEAVDAFLRNEGLESI